MYSTRHRRDETTILIAFGRTGLNGTLFNTVKLNTGRTKKKQSMLYYTDRNMRGKKQHLSKTSER